PPRTTTGVRTFKAQRDGDGYVFVQGGRTELGEISLTAHVTATGDVRDAAFSGAPVDDLHTDLTALAVSGARDIPERIIVGRTFSVGDEYYAGEEGQRVLEALRTSMGFPFPLSATIHQPFIGVVTEDGARVLKFEGDWTLSGSGEFRGVQMG